MPKAQEGRVLPQTVGDEQWSQGSDPASEGLLPSHGGRIRAVDVERVCPGWSRVTIVQGRSGRGFGADEGAAWEAGGWWEVGQEQQVICPGSLSAVTTPPHCIY